MSSRQPPRERERSSAVLADEAQALRLRGVDKVYLLGGARVDVLGGIDLEVSRGEIVVIVGGSGSGKSTLLRVIAGLEPRDRGLISVGGRVVAGPERDCGMVFQEHRLFPWMDVVENVAFGVAELPPEERRRTVADELYKKLVEERESFWTAVYPLYMQREITKDNVRDLVRKGLEEARGNYKIVAKLFNMEPHDYKKFLNFLRKHDCQLPFKEYRQ